MEYFIYSDDFIFNIIDEEAAYELEMQNYDFNADMLDEQNRDNYREYLQMIQDGEISDNDNDEEYDIDKVDALLKMHCAKIILNNTKDMIAKAA